MLAAFPLATGGREGGVAVKESPVHPNSVGSREMTLYQGLQDTSGRREGEGGEGGGEEEKDMGMKGVEGGGREEREREKEGVG